MNLKDGACETEDRSSVIGVQHAHVTVAMLNAWRRSVSHCSAPSKSHQLTNAVLAVLQRDVNMKACHSVMENSSHLCQIHVLDAHVW